MTSENIKNKPLIEIIKSKYILQDFGEVFQYLYEKQNIIPTLLEAEKQIRKIFNDEKLILKIVYDPEIIDGGRLIIAIHTKLDADRAFNKLKLLDRSWWLDTSYFVSNNLDIHIDFDEV